MLLLLLVLLLLLLAYYFSCCFSYIRGVNANSTTAYNTRMQVVCCRLTPVQKKIYKHLMCSKEIRHILNGKQTNILSSIGAIKKVLL